MASSSVNQQPTLLAPASLPRVEKKRATWWRSRLEPYRHFILFSWNALTFYQSDWLPGVSVWLGVNFAVLVLLWMSGSIIQTVGETLLILGVLYVLLQVACRTLEIEMFPEWVPEFETRFQRICIRLAYGEQLLVTLVGVALNLRKSKPWKFYCIILVISMLLIELGRWIPSAVFLEILLCLMMLQPLVLEYDLLSKENQKNFKLIVTEIYANLKQTLTGMSATARQRR